MKAYFVLIVALACATLTLGQTQSAPYDDFFDGVAKNSYANLTGWYNGTITDASAAVSPSVHAGMLADIISYYEINAGGASDMDQAKSLEYLPSLTTKWRAGELGLVWISMWDYNSSRIVYIPNWRGPVVGEEIWGIKIGDVEYAVVLLGDKSCGNGIFVPTENVKAIPQEAPVDNSRVIVMQDKATGDVYVTVNDYNTYNTEVVEKESEYDEYEVYGGEGDIYNTQIMQQPQQQWYSPMAQPWIQFSGSMWFGNQGWWVPQQQVCSAPSSGPVTIINEVTNEITIEWPDKGGGEIVVVGTDVDNGPGPGTDVGGDGTGGTDVGNGRESGIAKSVSREPHTDRSVQNVTRTENGSKADYAVYGDESRSKIEYQTASIMTDKKPIEYEAEPFIGNITDKKVKFQDEGKPQQMNIAADKPVKYDTAPIKTEVSTKPVQWSVGETGGKGDHIPSYSIMEEKGKQPSPFQYNNGMTEEEYYTAYLNNQKSQKYQYAEDAVDMGSQQYSQLAAKGWEGPKYMQNRKSYNNNYQPIRNPQFGNLRSYGSQPRPMPMAGMSRGNFGQRPVSRGR